MSSGECQRIVEVCGTDFRRGVARADNFLLTTDMQPASGIINLLLLDLESLRILYSTFRLNSELDVRVDPLMMAIDE